MNRRTHSLSFAIALTASAAVSLAQTTQPATRPAKPVATLHVGDMAPPLTVEKWLKGTPVTSLTDGKIHVVELWATWCGPCKAGMPHVSAVAKKYADSVVVSGIDVWERPAKGETPADVAGKVERFVARAGDMMGYNIAMDGAAARVAKDWAVAAAIPGIPSAFVVDKTGKIAWIGHPLMGMEDAIDALLAGKSGPELTAAVDAKWAERKAQMGDVGKQFFELMKQGKYTEALPFNDQLMTCAPYMAPTCMGYKYVILTHTDPAAAAKFGDELLTTGANAPLLLANVASNILGPAAYKVAGEPDYALARKLLEQASVCIEPDWMLDRSLADAYFHTGDPQKAVELQTTVVEHMHAIKGAAPAFQKTVDAAEAKLDTYKKAAAAKRVG